MNGFQHGKQSKNSSKEIKQSQQNGHQNDENDIEESDVQDMLDMIEDDDEDMVNGYGAASNKRKRDVNEVDESNEFEQEFAHRRNEEKSKRMKTVDLLPIKTKAGELVTRTTEVSIKERPKQSDDQYDEEEIEEEVIDSDDDIVNDTPTAAESLQIASGKAISTTDLLILREQELNRQKYRIGIICSGILEKPEDKMKNFNALFDLMSEKLNDAPNLLTVRKIATMSLLEVFKDILPEYRIGQIDLKTQKGKNNILEILTSDNIPKIQCFCF